LVKTPDMIRFKYNISGSWWAFFTPLDSELIGLHILKFQRKWFSHFQNILIPTQD
jgi:hypothetical protein